MDSGAEFSDGRKYRYALWRIWDTKKPYVMFVGLNPSTADETKNDPTITRCINYAKSWGYGGIYMTNLFAFRATDPSVMLAEEVPIGKDNDAWLKKIYEKTNIAVAAWGNDGSHRQRSKEIFNILPELHYLKLNATGEPAHPLYLKSNLKPLLFKKKNLIPKWLLYILVPLILTIIYAAFK